MEAEETIGVEVEMEVEVGVVVTEPLETEPSTIAVEGSDVAQAEADPLQDEIHIKGTVIVTATCLKQDVAAGRT